jgi:hypothetical protein
MRVVESTQEQHAHLESEHVHVETLVLYPLLLIHNVDEDTCIEDKAAEKEHHKVVAHLQRGIGAAICVDLNSPREETHRHIDWLFLRATVDFIFKAQDARERVSKQL